MSSYLFSCELLAAIRVEAGSEAEARKALDAALTESYANFGAWPNGNPITGECGLDARRDDPDLLEINGEPI
jgi:hypothetical protein